MSLKLLSINLLKKKLDLIKSNNLVFHSDLTILGRELFSLKGRLINYLFSELKAENLATPAFNLDKNSDDNIDMKSVDLKMGSLAKESVEECNKKKGYRLPHPIFSYCFFPKANKVKLISNNKSFGENSVFDFFIKNDFIWINFGADIDKGFTIFHHLEYISNVSYRRKFKYTRNLLDDNKVKKVDCEYFPRKSDEYIQNFSPAVKFLLKINVLKEIIVNGKSIYLGSSKSISEAILDKLIDDPYLLIKKKFN